MPEVKRQLALAVASMMTLSDANAASAPVDGRAQYEHCLSRAATNPKDALSEALEWQKTGGGPASDHRLPLALVGLHR